LILYEGIIGELPLGEDLLITEFRPPAAFVNYNLADLELPRRFGITVVAIRRAEQGAALLPDPKEPLQADDVLVVVSKVGAVARLIERS
jgi:trk system potassium uptake protein TrkA